MRYIAPETGAVFSNKHGATIILKPKEILVAGKSFIDGALKAGCRVEPDNPAEEAALKADVEAALKAKLEGEALEKLKAELRAEAERKVRAEMDEKFRAPAAARAVEIIAGAAEKKAADKK